MERTVIIVKPDGMEKNLAAAVLERFAKAGLRLVGCKMVQLDEKVLRDHYAHHADKPFFPELVSYMRSCPVLVCILEGDNVINRVRDLAGPTDSKLALKGTIRGDMGEDKSRNVIHASDSPESAQAEIRRFFKPEEVF
ncbi:MAG: nucleoside-diphosphate kinase [Verrucomicrobia bacterium GWF2_51_19]|nr:MAG: nucleoside-diphosphate kinase [Verrucomicrobia bacterium GWF2_51_19]HCJ11542.1 nucleoside-diphosphate kinase [Opitutae bacterium]